MTIGLLSSNLLATAANVLAGSASKLATTDILLAASAPVALTDAAQIAVNLASLVYGTVTIAASRTLANPTGHKVGRNFYIKVKQPAGGNCTLSYDTQYDFGQSTAPVLSTAGDTEDLLAFFTASATKIVYLGIRKGV